MSRLSLLLLASLLLSGAAFGQALVLTDGSRVPAADFTLDGDNIIRTLRINGSTATAALSRESIARLDWPEPPELVEARNLMAGGKSEEALALLKKTLDFFQKFEKIEGNWYLPVFFAYVETLSQAGRFEETIRLLPQLRTLPLSDEQKMSLRIIELDIGRQTSNEYGSIMAEARSILAETDDSAAGAALWMILADIHAKKKEWEKALMAYLRIPVFYGAQIQRVPDAEMKAGQMLVKMKRYEDAHSIFARLAESHQGSAIGERAAQAKASVSGMKNEPEKEPETPPQEN